MDKGYFYTAVAIFFTFHFSLFTFLCTFALEMESNKVIRWYPMRVTYHRELKIKEQLDTLGIDSFVPMHYDLADTSDGPRKILVPAIHNLIFVHASQEVLTALKMHRKEFEPMRYMTTTSADGHKELLHVPDRQMEHFIRVASIQDDSIIFLDVRDSANLGRRVRITAGRFKGVEGVIKRIKKNKYFLIQIDGVAAVAITYVPADCLVPL